MYVYDWDGRIAGRQVDRTSILQVTLLKKDLPASTMNWDFERKLIDCSRRTARSCDSEPKKDLKPGRHV